MIKIETLKLKHLLGYCFNGVFRLVVVPYMLKVKCGP